MFEGRTKISWRDLLVGIAFVIYGIAVAKVFLL